MPEKYLRNIKAQQLGTFLGNSGIPSYGKLIYVAPASSGYQTALADVGLDVHTTLALGYAQATTNHNDVVLRGPGTYDQTATTTWSKSGTHLLGMVANYRYANGVLIEETSATSLTPLLTVSGSNNVFKNLHFRYAIGSQAANINCLTITGDGNLFENCWFEGPCDNSVADLATSRLIKLGGANNTFKNCHIGGTWVPMSAANALVEYTNTTYEATFEDCTFNLWIDATTPSFIYVKTGKAQMMQYYRNCQFYAMATNQAYDMANLIAFEGDDATGHHLFDNRCQAYNVTCITTGVNPRLSTYWGICGDTGGGATIGRAITTT